MAVTEEPGSIRPPGTIRGVLFDVDDTLVDTRGAFRHALAGVVARHLPPGVTLDAVATFWRADRHGFYRAHTRGEMDHREQRMRRANDLHVEFGGVDMDDDAYDAWDAEFEQGFREGWSAFADVHACLDALDGAGIAFGGLSNARFAYQQAKLATVGLERVPMLVGVDTLGYGKPDPAVFLEGCRLLGLAPHEVAYIGDELDIDAQAARRAGMAGYWLDRSGSGDREAPAASGTAHNSTTAASDAGAVDVPRVRNLGEFTALIRG
jgi:putative hydrolase of the HAD superfamily